MGVVRGGGDGCEVVDQSHIGQRSGQVRLGYSQARLDGSPDEESAAGDSSDEKSAVLGLCL